MKIGLRNPALAGANVTRWGDYHFGRSLAAALERQGAEVAQCYWPQWDRLGRVDACITLRGKRAAAPHPGATNVIWVISHPGEVSREELAGYDVVLTASETHREMLGDGFPVPVEVMRQCTDVTLFRTARPLDQEAAARHGVLFVANSRGVRRQGPAALLDAGLPLAIVGRHWDALGLGRFVRERYVENDRLPALYAGCRLALNDHWCDMKYFGIINNRIFDCLATGTPVITDRFPELEAVCGDGVLYWEDAAALSEAIGVFRSDYDGLLARTRALWQRLATDYSFDRRAVEILGLLGGRRPSAAVPSQLIPQALDPAIESALAALSSAVGARPIRLLHLEPPPEARYHLAAREGCDYLTAGRGVGPWLVDIAGGLEALPRAKFHGIIFDRRLGFDQEALRPLLAANGRLVVLGPSVVAATGGASVG
jgi:hypothetical protein